MPKAQSAGVPYISTKDFTASGIEFGSAKLISEERLRAAVEKIAPEKGDILISRYGTVGEVRTVTTSQPFQASYSVAIVKTCKNEGLTKWLSLVLASPPAQDFMREHIRASAQPDLGLQHIRLIPVPIAPLAEQAEAIRRAEKLFTTADRIEERINAAATRVGRGPRAMPLT
jgi:type I restriction enzyme S subunit